MADKRKVWVLTCRINDYNQEGAYFEAVLEKHPSVIQMAEVLGVSEGTDIMAALALVEHVRAGGGRRGTEDRWYMLEQVDLR